MNQVDCFQVGKTQVKPARLAAELGWLANFTIEDMSGPAEFYNMPYQEEGIKFHTVLLIGLRIFVR